MNTRPSPISTTNTYHDNPQGYAREFRAIPAAEPEGLVTQVERIACAGLDLAERVSEPVTPWDVARLGVRVVAWAARKLR